MNLPHHYLPNIMFALFHQHGALIKAHKKHQTPEGWTMIVKCQFTGQEYRLDITPIKSEVEAKNLTFESVMKEFNKN